MADQAILPEAETPLLDQMREVFAHGERLLVQGKFSGRQAERIPRRFRTSLVKLYGDDSAMLGPFKELRPFPTPNDAHDYLSAYLPLMRNMIKGLEAGPFSGARNSRGDFSPADRRVFIVHGHDELTKERVARFVEKIGFEAVILHEQASKGMTIIEKIETNTDVGFAIVLYTGDDSGNTGVAAAKGELNRRARQNVVFEHGYLIAKLGRSHVVPLVSRGVELPSDISGVVYVDDTNWQIDVAKEMKGAGYSVDFNKILGG